MDTLTHALSGALLARATEPASLPPGALPRGARQWVGFWAAAFPDSDFVLRLVDPLTYLTAHRGVTHSLLLLPLWALLLALLFVLLYRGRYSWRVFAPITALGIGAHIAGDVITTFGTMVFAPVTAVRVAFPFSFIIDPYFSAILVLGLIAAARQNTTRAPAVAALAVLVGYIGAQAWLQQQALQLGRDYIARTNLAAATASALPQPFSPFNWMIVIEQPDAYHLAYVSLLRREPAAAAADAHWLHRAYAAYLPADQARWAVVPRFGVGFEQIERARALWESEVLAEYRRFTLFPALYRVDTDGTRQCFWFNDLRFALEGRDAPFRYGACRDGDSPWAIHPLVEAGATP
jgi:inner membrane protein